MSLGEQTNQATEIAAFRRPATEMVRVRTNRFGEMEVPVENRFQFPKGLPGFPGMRDMFLFPNPGGGCFEWLHSATPNELGFAVLMPDEAIMDVLHDPLVTAARLLGWSAGDQIEVRLIVTIPSGSPDQATLNLRAPVLLNRTRAQGAQPVLNDDALPVRLRLFPEPFTSEGE